MEFNQFGRISINVISFNPINFLSINRWITPPPTLNTIVNQICIGRVLQVSRVFLKPIYLFFFKFAVRGLPSNKLQSPTFHCQAQH